jgi:hypothetical protein
LEQSGITNHSFVNRILRAFFCASLATRHTTFSATTKYIICRLFNSIFVESTSALSFCTRSFVVGVVGFGDKNDIYIYERRIYLVAPMDCTRKASSQKENIPTHAISAFTTSQDYGDSDNVVDW